MIRTLHQARSSGKIGYFFIVASDNFTLNFMPLAAPSRHAETPSRLAIIAASDNDRRTHKIGAGDDVMPTELRKIIFSQRELLEAFEQRPHNATSNTEAVPRGAVRGVHVFQKFGGGVKVLLDIEDEKEQRRKRFNLNAEFISEILLQYCANLNIPVAREAEKYLEVIGDNLALSQKIRAQEVFADFDLEPPPID